MNQSIKWALLGAVPGVLLIALAGPVEPELDLLLGVGGFAAAVVGALVGALAGREHDPEVRRQVAWRSGLGAAAGVLLMLVQPFLGAALAIVLALFGAGSARRRTVSDRS